MRSIVFTSTSTRTVSDLELSQILAASREKNAAIGVTGLLAVKGPNALGIIEGEDEVVRTRFEEIRRDPRHTNVQVLLDEAIEQRSFPDWSVALQPADPAAPHVPGLCSLFDAGVPGEASTGSVRARGLLDWFRKHPLAPLAGLDPDADRTRRRRAVNGAIDALREDGLRRFTLADAARRAEMTEPELQAVFPTEQALLIGALETWTNTISAPLLPLVAETGTVRFVHALLVAHADEPALMELIAAGFAAAVDPRTDGAVYHRSVYRRFRQLLRDGLADDVRAGREPATLDPDRGAEQLLALCDGLRLQVLLTGDVELVPAFDRAAQQLRRGWAAQEEPETVWDVPVAGRP